MKEACQPYLDNYSCIDFIGHLIKSAAWNTCDASIGNHPCLIPCSRFFFWNVPQGGRMRYRPDMEGWQHFWHLDILWSTFQSDNKVQSNP